ncbi:uncharacterized protein LOC121404061, partial [Drosophila obscura]|uniref:uncharacterized protein LOC121404061 n=1 Tax=Drosophila obscura TaxID=7282 RepID=UPI001BB11C81
MSQPPFKIRRMDFGENEEPLRDERIISVLKEEMQLLRDQNRLLMEKVDVMADKLAEVAALVKVQVKGEQVVPGAITFPIITEEELDMFEELMTPQLKDIKQVWKLLEKELLSRCLKSVLDEQV